MKRIDQTAAHSWSKDRIREEITDLRRMIADQERVCEEDSEDIRRSGGYNQDFSHINFMRSAIPKWEDDINFLKGLLY